MFSITEIIRRDAATYYEGDSGNRVSRGRSMSVSAILSLSLGFLVGTASDDFLTGALSAQAILVGFSFNVLFYLVANRLTAPASFSGLEHELRFERLSTLSDEVFDNVTYFNLVAICSAIAALVLLLAGSERFDANLDKIGALIAQQTRVERAFLSWAKWGTSAVGLSVLIFLLAESIHTFLRTVGRVRFYFGMLKTMHDDVQA